MLLGLHQSTFLQIWYKITQMHHQPTGTLQTSRFFWTWKSAPKLENSLHFPTNSCFIVCTVCYLSLFYFKNVNIMLTVCSHVLNALQIFFFQPLQVKPLLLLFWRWGMEKPLPKGTRLACAELHRVMMPNIRARTAQKPHGWDSSLDENVNSLRWSTIYSSLSARSSASGNDSHTRSKRQHGTSKGMEEPLLQQRERT